MTYRKEIDGLRAIAVIPVVLFHAGFSAFSGGYIGVDVFFVISGYLITTILVTDLQKGTFSFWGFYERRARRILPALFTVIFACIPFAWMWMLPIQFKDFGQSMISVGLFISNFLFWIESGYFEAAAEQKPLLHTWSLSVEEQFYVLFPILLFFTWQFKRNLVLWLIIAIAVASFIFSELLGRVEPDANFYLTPTRAWELLAGSIAAFLVINRGVRDHNGLALLGLCSIIVPMFIYNEHTRVPGVLGLVPVIGTCLVLLFSGQSTIVAKFLSLRGFVDVGLISYSLYLWHQPVFAFARIRMGGELALTEMVALSILSVAFALLTWRFVEQPFRGRMAFFPERRRLLQNGVIGLCACIVVGAFVQVTNGLPSRLPTEVRDVLAARSGDSSGCHNRLDKDAILNGESCRIGTFSAPPKLAFLGDSHVSRLMDAVGDQLGVQNLSALTYNGSFCVPLHSFTTDAPKKNGCDWMSDAIDAVVQNPKIDTVVLFAQWANYTAGKRLRDKISADYTFSLADKDDAIDQMQAGNSAAFNASTKFTFDKLAQAKKHVVVVLPTPEFKSHVPQAIAYARLHDQEVPTLFIEQYVDRTGDAVRALTENAAYFGFELVSSASVFCDDQICTGQSKQGRPLFEDDNHLNYAGAKLLARPLFEKIWNHQELAAN